jgi:hypothetical protein
MPLDRDREFPELFFGFGHAPYFLCQFPREERRFGPTGLERF